MLRFGRLVISQLGLCHRHAPSRPHTAAYTTGLTANRKERKRFYKSVSVSEVTRVNDTSQFEISLDSRKLKTPGGLPLQVGDKLLAHMIAHEWHSQQGIIKQSTMHLTSLTNTCMDNPTKTSKENLIEQLSEYLQTDTLLFFDSNSIEKLERLQETKWRPLVDWFNLKFNDLSLKISYGLDVPTQLPVTSDASKPNSFHHYLSRDFGLSSLMAFNYMAECLKSTIITVALLERYIPTVEEACRLAMLEQEHQYAQWGKVEWYHDVNEQELRARVSAALLFIYLSHDSKYYLIKANNSK